MRLSSPAVEEMNSLHKFSKNDPSEQEHGLKRYYFPPMPDTTSSAGSANRANAIFPKLSGELKNNPYNSGSFSARGSIENAKAEANSIEKEAYAEGFKNGERQGFESIRERFEPILDGFRNAIFSLEEANRALSLSAEEQAVRLAMAIAEKIVHHEVRINKEVILEILRAALKKVSDHKKVKIRVSPDDLLLIQQSKPDFLDIQDRLATIAFEEDPSITKGGCVVETELGDVDARIEKQIQAITDAFRSETRKLQYGG